MQRNLAVKVLTIINSNEASDQNELVIMGFVMGGVIMMCPVILRSVYNLTTDIQSYSITLADRTKALKKEKKRTDSLLFQMIPKQVAEVLKKNEEVMAEMYSESTIFFSDIVSFTHISARSSPIQVVNMLNILYTSFDGCMAMYDVYKVETIGDAYMVASGVPVRNGQRHASEIATLSLDILHRIQQLEIPHMPGNKFKLRIGVHSGPVVAGVVGNKMPRYCLFGLTVILASRMEATGKAGRIHLSDATNNILEGIGGFYTTSRKDMDPQEAAHVHGKGRLQGPASLCTTGRTHWLMGREGFDVGTPVDIDTSSSEDYGDDFLKDAVKPKDEEVKLEEFCY